MWFAKPQVTPVIIQVTGTISESFRKYLDNKNKLNGEYVYRHKHNYNPYSTFTITKVQLHVSAINVGHFKVVHEAIMISYI